VCNVTISPSTNMFITSKRTNNVGNKPNKNLTAVYISTLFYVLQFKFGA
jgi:hypothetical protein